jgi:hypothetical protein
MAGQRGASGNVGLAARNIGQQGATTQEQAAGQAATLQAQQQIAAQQNLANLSNQQVAQAQGATTALNTAQQNEQNILQNANTAQNNAAVGMQSNINNVNAQANQGILGGIGSGLSAVTGGLFEEGGKVTSHPKHKLDFVHKMTKMGLEHFDEGTPNGPISAPSPAPSSSSSWLGGPQSAQASDTPPSSGVQSAQDSMRKAFHYAEGTPSGPIQANPLVGAITNSPAAMATTPGYSAVMPSSGPNIAQPMGSSSDGLSQGIKNGLAAGQAWHDKRAKNAQDANNANLANISNQNAQMMSGPSTVGPNANVSQQNADMMAGPSQGTTPLNPDDTTESITQGDDQYHAKGGEIFDMPPMHHGIHAKNHFEQYFAKGGQAKKVPAMLSPGEVYLPPDAVERVKHGADPLKEGMRVPGKAKVKGDSLKNDDVPATLEEGGVVIDREHVGHPDKARLFVLKSLRATGKHMKKPEVMK